MIAGSPGVFGEARARVMTLRYTVLASGSGGNASLIQAGLVFASAALAGEPFFLFCLGAQMLAYGVGIQGLSTRPLEHPLLRPVRYFFVMNLALLIGFVRFIRGTQRVTWEQAQRS